MNVAPVSVAEALELSGDPLWSAKSAGLRYVTGYGPGILRARKGKAFRYLNADGSSVTDPVELRRIRVLAIPPAWTAVWICPLANGHIQATGRDARGRKQYRYHARWREVRDDAKFGRMVAFAAALPKIRARAERDLSRSGLPREKVLGAVVRLLEKTLIRVGNEEYARQNDSFGLTTLRNKHVDVDGSTLRFQFRGKSGVEHVVEAHDRRLARIVERCQELPGYELFQYVDGDGKRQSIESADVNAYLREVAGEAFTAKDFRTWHGTVLTACALRDSARAPPTKKTVTAAVKAVAARLGNTPTVCRRCYVHPSVIACYMGGAMPKVIARAERSALRAKGELEAEEEFVLALLRSRSAYDAMSLEDKLRGGQIKQPRKAAAPQARPGRGLQKNVSSASARPSGSLAPAPRRQDRDPARRSRAAA